jgi:hypothetical protein
MLSLRRLLCEEQCQQILGPSPGSLTRMGQVCDRWHHRICNGHVIWLQVRQPRDLTSSPGCSSLAGSSPRPALPCAPMRHRPSDYICRRTDWMVHAVDVCSVNVRVHIRLGSFSPACEGSHTAHTSLDTRYASHMLCLLLSDQAPLHLGLAA